MLDNCGLQSSIKNLKSKFSTTNYKNIQFPFPLISCLCLSFLEDMPIGSEVSDSTCLTFFGKNKGFKYQIKRVWSSSCFLFIILVNIFCSCYANLPPGWDVLRGREKRGRGNWGIGKQRRQIILRSFSSVIWFENMFWNYYPCQCCILANIVCSFYADLLPSQWDVLRGKEKRWRELGNWKTVLSDNITILHSQTIFRVFSWDIW